MVRRARHSWLLCLGTLAILLVPAIGRADEDVDELQEKVIKAAAKKIAPCVVQIETSGGTDIISAGPRGAMVRKGTGPTTGLIVSADGYIISSAFNFANKPSSIIVAIPGQKERKVAKAIATDQTRMLTLLKIEAVGLPVPTAAGKSEMVVGQTAIAVGRTLAGNVELPPSVSVGIVSAVNRIWGKALQTDAKVSPVNYGGPLLDLTGRVLGVLVPADPVAEGETAGITWYDSGIGFAIPLEDINANLSRLKLGKDLKRGMLGITMKNQDQYADPPVVGSVAPGSAAEKAGIKSGDQIKNVDGKSVYSHASLLHVLGSKYEGDAVTVTVERGGKEQIFPVVLSGLVAAYGQPFIGLLPVRDDPEPGMEIRYVYPKSPADTAGLKEGDRVMKASRSPAFGQPAPVPTQAVANRETLFTMLSAAQPGMEVKLEVVRKEGKKTEVVTLKLVDTPNDVPEKLPEKATAKKALAKPVKKEEPKKDAPKKEEPKKEEPKKEEPKKDEKKPETGLLKRTTAAADHSFWIYVPDNYDPNIANAVVVWLHPPGKNKDKDIDDFINAWQWDCEDHNIILVGPKADNDTGWTPSEADFIQQAVKAVTDNYTVDRRRIVVHGMGVGGQMAFYLGFQNRALFRGVATTGAALASNPKEKVANLPLSFFLAVGEKDPVKDAVKDTETKLVSSKYPTIFRSIPNRGHQYLDLKTLEELVRWIDSLDRL